GRSFRARLALEQSEEGKWRVEFDEPWAKEGAKIDPAAEAGEPADGAQPAAAKAAAEAAA
ncbi:MAG: topoisomerase, partial [bacterium]